MTTLNHRSLPWHLGTGQRVFSQKGRESGRSIPSNAFRFLVTVSDSLKSLVGKVSLVAVPIIISTTALLIFIATLFMSNHLGRRIQKESMARAKELSSLMTTGVSWQDVNAAKVNVRVLERDAGQMQEIIAMPLTKIDPRLSS